MKDNSARTKIALVIFGALTSTYLIITAYQSKFLHLYRDYIDTTLSKSNYDPEMAYVKLEESAAALEALQILGALFAIGSIFAFLFWFRRAYANLHRAQVPNLRYRDNATIWPFFTPVLSAFMPMLVAWDLWKKSRRHLLHLGLKSPSPLVPVTIVLWWITFTGMCLLNGIAGLSYGDDLPPGKMLTALETSLIANSAAAIAGLATFLMILALSRQLRTLYQNYAVWDSPEEINAELLGEEE